MPDKKLFLLDAMALIYRAHFAFSKNPRINSKGLNTGAPLGFTNTLLEVINKEKPTHIAVAFDTPAPTFRHKEFPEYKAQRQEQPEDITIAIPIVKQLIEAFNVPILELEGYEADDIIGTVAKQAAKKDFEVFMMTPDKDYGQLVEEHIYLYKPAFMGNGVEVMGIEQVLDKWQISRVNQVIDMLGLQGDSVDNIPGIPGIGPKTAVKLLAQYDTVEGLIANTDILKGKQKEKVTEFAEQGLLSKRLATIDIEVPIAWEEQQMLFDGPDKDALKKIFSDLEFKTLYRRIFGETLATAGKPVKTSGKPSGGQQDPNQLSLFGAAPATEEKKVEEIIEEAQPIQTIKTTPHRYWLLDTDAEMDELVKFLALQKEFCFDTETTSLSAIEAELVGIAFSYRSGEAYYVPVPEDKGQAQQIVDKFRVVFEHEGIGKVGQNIKYDAMVLANYGIALKGKVFDTMLAHYLLQPDMRHNMDVLAEAYLNYAPVSIEEIIGKKGKKQKSMRDAEVALVKEYAGEDADITWQLKQKFEPMLKEKGLNALLDNIEHPLVAVLAQVEQNGVKVDTAALEAFSAELAQEAMAVEKNIAEEAGAMKNEVSGKYEIEGKELNVNSPKQLGEILFDRMKLVEKPKKTKTGQYATDEETLQKLAAEHGIVRQILDYRQLQKLRSTYVDALPALISPKDGLIHTSYNQAVAATGRLSSTNPNLQNIPIRTDKGREIRKAFVPRSEEFVLLAADYSQVELRIMAAFSKDETMMKAFQQGKDIHAATAAKVFKVPVEEVDSDMRRKAKTANFGIIYGISAFGLSQRLNIPRKEAGAIIDAYFEEFPAVKKYMDEIVNFARENEYVETIMGRRRYLRDINSRNFTQRGFAERNAINAPIQGSAADIIKKAMIEINAWMAEEGLKSKMIMQVHDELVFDVHKSELELMEEKVKGLMEGAIDIGLPLEVEVGKGMNWLEAH